MKRVRQTRIGVVAQDSMRLAGLQSILESFPDVVSRAATFDEAVAASELELILLDSACVQNLPEALARLRRERSAAKVIVLGNGPHPLSVQGILAAGARGFLLGTADEDEIHTAIHAVRDGSTWTPRDKPSQPAATARVASPPEMGPLAGRMTVREQEVLRLLMDGQTNRQIAEVMGIEQVTVKAHLGRMLRKARVKNRIELTVKAMADPPPTAADSSD